MNKAATAKTIVAITASVIVGALWFQCGPSGGIELGGHAGTVSVSRSAGAAGSHAGGGGGTVAAGSGGAIIDLPPLGGAGGSSSSSTFVTPTSPDANCGTQTKNPTPRPVDLLLVLDRSGSMAQDIATDTACTGGGRATCSPKWPAMTTSLNQVLSSSSTGVQWGLKFFGSPNKPACTVDPGAEVGVGPGTAAKIQAQMNGTSPADNTPTMAAINAAVTYFGTVNDGLGHYILLATDGLPNCDPGTSGTSTDTSIQDAADAIAAALSAGVKTYVVGIGSSAGNLDKFAQAGGTDHYFPATSPDELTAALSSIVVAVASCTFTMGKVPPDPANIGVYLDKNTKVPLGASDGYSLAADNVTVTLNGSYCDGLKNRTYQVVQVFFGCPGSPPPPYM